MKPVAIYIEDPKDGQTHLRWVGAGPTRQLPAGYKLVRCAAEIKVDEDRVAFDVATQDFQPFDDAVLQDTVPDILQALLEGQKLYIGCMGGIGRTGTLLAILVGQHPTVTGDAAIDYVRRCYDSRACETAEQEDQVCRHSQPDALWEIEPPRFVQKVWSFFTGRG